MLTQPPAPTPLPPQAAAPQLLTTSHASPRFTEIPGPVPYSRGLALQQEAVGRILSAEDRGTVFVLEHEAVFTAGRRSEVSEYPPGDTPVVPVNRGGKVTWHGPGQLVVYPVIRLRPEVGVVDLVRHLETAIISALDSVGVRGLRVAGRSGVWAETPDGTLAKVAQIGLHASAGIITHGIAVNCSNDLTPFSTFVACGIRDAAATSVSELTGRKVTPAMLVPALSRSIAVALAEVAA